MSSDDLAPGARLGRYEVVRRIGRGGFGTVYEATHRELRKRVAVKVLHREFALHPTVRARFTREAVAASGLRHPHVVDVTDVGVSEGQPYIVMEFLEGETLRERCAREGALPVTDALDLLLPVFDAIAAAHEQGVVHRDLKPDNVFLARAGLHGAEVPKLLDFGIVKMRGDAPDRKGTLTGSGALLGTPAYMSPEQAQNLREVDARSDQFSLGAIVYECVTGRRAFEGEGMIDILHRVAVEPVTPPRSLRPDLPVGLDAAVLRALEKSPSARFDDVRAFGAALLPFASARMQALWSAAFTRGADERPSRPPSSPEGVAPSPSREVGPQTLHRMESQQVRGRRWPLLAGTAALIATLLAGAEALRERLPGRSATAAPRPAPAPTPAPVAAVAPASEAALIAVVPPPPSAPPQPVPVRVAQVPHAPVQRRVVVHRVGADAGVDGGARRRAVGPNGAVIED